jgi:glycosyltransferase involved in cell wall biosynthesis
MRVLHTQKVKGMGGSERHLLTLLPALVERGVEVRLLVLGAGSFRRFLDEALGSRIDTRVISAGPDLNPVMARKIAREIREFRPDLLHTHLIHADVYGYIGARLAGVPRVSSIHSVHSFYRKEPIRTIARRAGRPAIRTIAISEHVARYVDEIGLARRDRIRTVPYGVDVAGWQVGPTERAAARRGYGVTDDALVLGIASNLIPGKGHATLLDAFAIVRRDLPRARLLIAGDGPLRSELGLRVRSLGLTDAVDFLGYVQDTRIFMGACDVVVFPTHSSLGEGFGLAALEAGASGKPVVASRMGPLPEIVADGANGFLVAPQDVAELATAVVKLGGDAVLRAEMGAAGRDRARRMFSVDQMVGRTIAVYAEALA